VSAPQLRRLLAPVLLGLLAAAGWASAAPLRDYRHTSWGANEGVPAQIPALSQTPDGWLWLGTADGLYRFDGITFEHVALPTRGMLARRQINTAGSMAVPAEAPVTRISPRAVTGFTCAPPMKTASPAPLKSARRSSAPRR
jgi:ligand-binding sensor domain-containing protein